MERKKNNKSYFYASFYQQEDTVAMAHKRL